MEVSDLHNDHHEAENGFVVGLNAFFFSHSRTGRS